MTATPAPPVLLEWWAARSRDLPWRRTRDPWLVLVSECMLHQTQVARVVPRYLAFAEHFPTPADCASAPVADVVRLWEGLGYNRRAVNLHRLAVAVCERHGGELPRSLPELLALPGVGRYTARAVLAFAFEADVGVVDTNAARVLARCAGHRLGASEVQSLADRWVPAGEGWAWNQAMLDLGATICRARRPACEICPLAGGHCAWRRSCDTDDPAVGSAGVSGTQPRFDGSDRQGRGRLVDALRRGPVEGDRLAAVMGWPAEPERAERVAATLMRDGLAACDGNVYRLPGEYPSGGAAQPLPGTNQPLTSSTACAPTHERTHTEPPGATGTKARLAAAAPAT